MGGYGSGRKRFAVRVTVEECYVLNIGPLLRERFFRPLQSSVHGAYSARQGQQRIQFRFDFWDTETDSCLEIHYRRYGEEIELPIPITSTRAHFGGYRLYFICPICGINERLSKLYLPPGEQYFACRRCYDLTYASCNRTRVTLPRVFLNWTGIDFPVKYGRIRLGG